VIEAAWRAAMNSPCQKSKRGVVAFNPERHDELSPVNERGLMGGVRERHVIAGTGFNGPPRGFLCDGSPECRADCAKFCMHAESRAIRAAGILDDVDMLVLVHVKVANDRVVPGGPPSCWQCSREILDVGLRGVWLYETATCTCPPEEVARIAVSSSLPPHRSDCRPVAGMWRYYAAYDFHVATLRNCGIAGVPA
jgi:hypothetical protein